jgi:hypothetical protein
MPYSIRKIGKNRYQVYNTATGEIHSKGTTKKKAEGQFRLLQGVARKDMIGLEGGANPMQNPDLFGYMRQYLDPRETYINMLTNLRQHYLQQPPPHQPPPVIQVTEQILQNPQPIYNQLDAGYERFVDEVNRANTGGMPGEEWNNIVSWVSGGRSDEEIYNPEWSTRQELEEYSPENLRYILTALGVNLDSGQPTALTDSIVGSQLSRLEWNAYDPVAEYNQAEGEMSVDDDDMDIEGRGRGQGRMRGGFYASEERTDMFGNKYDMFGNKTDVFGRMTPSKKGAGTGVSRVSPEPPPSPSPPPTPRVARRPQKRYPLELTREEELIVRGAMPIVNKRLPKDYFGTNEDFIADNVKRLPRIRAKKELRRLYDENEKMSREDLLSSRQEGRGQYSIPSQEYQPTRFL